MIQHLVERAPFIASLTATDDMGYEFSAVVPEGVIYSEPGMLLNGSDDSGNLNGEFPFEILENDSSDEVKRLVHHFLIDNQWNVILWNELSDEEVENWFDATKL